MKQVPRLNIASVSWIRAQLCGEFVSSIYSLQQPLWRDTGLLWDSKRNKMILSASAENFIFGFMMAADQLTTVALEVRVVTAASYMLLIECLSGCVVFFLHATECGGHFSSHEVDRIDFYRNYIFTSRLGLSKIEI